MREKGVCGKKELGLNVEAILVLGAVSKTYLATRPVQSEVTVTGSPAGAARAIPSGEGRTVTSERS